MMRDPVQEFNAPWIRPPFETNSQWIYICLQLRSVNRLLGAFTNIYNLRGVKRLRMAFTIIYN